MGWLTKVIGGAKAVVVASSPSRVGPNRSSSEESDVGALVSFSGGGTSKRVEWSRSRVDSGAEGENSSARNEMSMSRKSMSSRTSRSYSSTLVTSQDKNLTQLAAFSPAIAHWELEHQTTTTYEPSTWELKVGLLFVDISGFTNLCTRLDIDALQRHINCYFTMLIDIVVGRGGDVLRFAGDAIFCAWSLDKDADDDALASAVHAACGCALELNDRCGSYPIPEIGAQLSIHSGVGVGTFHSFRIGSAERWEFMFAGDVNRQVAEAEGHAKLRETVVSPEAWRLVSSVCVGEPRGSSTDGGGGGGGGGGNMLLCGLAPNCPDPGALGAAPELRAALVCDELLTLQRKQTSQLVLSAATHEAPLRAYVHDTARRAVEADVLHQVAEQRLVVTTFCMVMGLEPALLSGAPGLPAVQSCIGAAQRCIEEGGGLLRQFILDDKGVVIIWTFGLPGSTYEDNPLRGLSTALAVNAAIKAQGLEPRTGVTSGTAFCGLVRAAPHCTAPHHTALPPLNPLLKPSGVCPPLFARAFAPSSSPSRRRRLRRWVRATGASTR